MKSILRGLRGMLTAVLVVGLVIGADSPAFAATSQSSILMSGNGAISGN